jgi:hypothetical protein
MHPERTGDGFCWSAGRDIKRPGFVSHELFEQERAAWNVPTFDLWEKLVLRARATSPSAKAMSGSLSIDEGKDEGA